MTLLIAYLLMYQVGAEPMAYVAVLFVWICHLGYHENKRDKKKNG